jgi:hypothetical protein
MRLSLAQLVPLSILLQIIGFLVTIILGDTLSYHNYMIKLKHLSIQEAAMSFDVVQVTIMS